MIAVCIYGAGLPPPHAECRNNSYMLIVVMQIYVKDIIETKTNKKLHLPGTGGKQSEDIRQSSFFWKTASAWGVSAGGFFLHQTSFYTKLFYSGQELPKWNSLPLNTPLPSCLIAIHGQEYPLPREPVMFSRSKMFGKIKKHSFILFVCLLPC